MQSILRRRPRTAQTCEEERVPQISILRHGIYTVAPTASLACANSFSTCERTSSRISSPTVASSSVKISGGHKRIEVSPHPKDHEAALKRQLLNAIAQLCRRLASFLVLHQLDPDHQAASAHIPDKRVRLLPSMQSLQHLRASTFAAFSIAPPCSTSNVASAAASAIGFPPNVDACDPGTQSMTSALLIQTPKGIPLAIPLAEHTMSGSTPEC